MEKHNKKSYSDERLISVGQSIRKVNHDTLINSGLTEFQAFFEVDWKKWRRLGCDITTNKVSALYQGKMDKTNLASVVLTSGKYCDDKSISFRDLSLSESRCGGPCSYKVDFLKFELYAMRWRYKTQHFTNGAY